ncbi:hypothetical protein GCM10011361_00620 [Muriicola marianensis]|uniref:Type IX secretion system membrane protein PorP/SprF n=2 Tax=Muriicola marianensis TaxID=1324801 RepID=A0ABQ1QQ28_9FLAO|nr:hypothetical protein GCM10011361_00620 [Muriicola marianensis]
MNRNSAFGVGFLQQNTGLFLQTGGVLNYAYAFDLGQDISLAMGLNLLGFRQELADDRFQQSPGAGLPQLNNEPSFVLQAAPGIQFGYGNFNLGLAVENALEYNLTEGDQNNGSDEKIFLGSTSLVIPVKGSGLFEEGYIRPMVFVKTVPELDTQFGINTLFSTDQFWIQGGYHNFFGISGGLGGTFFGKFSFGVLIEIATSADLEAADPSFEIVTSYHFRAPDLRRKIVGFDIEEEPLAEIPEKKKKLSQKERKALAEAQAQKEKDSLIMIANRKDSVAMVQRKAEEDENARIAKVVERRKDSLEEIAKIQAERVREKSVIPREGERFEEAVISEDVTPGFYLIVNAFGTERYLELFVKTLSEKGLNPRFFYRTDRQLNYVYLERYDSMQEARKARDSKFFGKYSETIWIFRVREQ